MIKLLVGILICISLFSCKKEKVQVEEPVLQPATEDYYCQSLLPPELHFISPTEFTDYDETYYNYPIINPNNPAEIVYLNGNFPNGKIMFYNLDTKEKRVLFDGNSGSSFSWSKKDWILFQDTENFSIFKIKSNGDSLTKLSFDGNIFFPKWNHDGTKFICSKKFATQYSFIMNEDGHVIDSITDWHHTNGNWSHPQYYVGESTFEIKFIDLENHVVFDHLYFDHEVSFIGWASISEIYYRIGRKLILYDIYTKKKTVVKDQCYRSFNSADATADYSRILFQVIESKLEPNNRLFLDSKLVLMKKDGTEEIEILP